MVGRTEKDARPSRGTQERTGRILSTTDMSRVQFGQIRPQSGENTHCQTLGHAQRTKVFTIKRNNQYACLSTERFKILDITQYLAAGTNYDSFLKAYDVPVSKGFFPYEWFDDVLKLEYQSLPPHESFYSSLKQTNISLQDYEFCQRMWVERRMRTFKDFLEWYNNLDVEPFVTVVERLRGYYFERGIDMFKISVSVPRLVRQMLFECGVLLYLTKPTAIFTGPSNKASLKDSRLSFRDFTKTTRPSYEEIPKRAVKKFLDSTPMGYISTALINPCRPDRSSDDVWRTGFIPRSVIDTLSCSIG